MNMSELRALYDVKKKNPNTFYRNEFVGDSAKRKSCDLVNYKNMVNAGGQVQPATQVIAKWIMEEKIFDGIKLDAETKGDYIEARSKIWQHPDCSKRGFREEEYVAKAFYCRKEPWIGSDIDEVVTYQAPVCRNSKKETSTGKVDLVAASHEKRELYLMELKTYDSSESLLRCVAEIYTYYKQIEKDKFAKQAEMRDYTVVPAVLVFADMFQHKQYDDMQFSNVRALMKKLGVRIFVIESDMEFNKNQIMKYSQNCRIREI